MSDETALPAESAGETETHGQIQDLSDLAGKDTLGAIDHEAKKPEPEPEPEQDDVTGDRPKRPSGSARLKAQLEAAKAELAALYGAIPQQDETASFDRLIEHEIGAPPKESDFPDFLDFQAEKVAWLASKKTVARELKQRALQAQAAQQAEADDLVDSFRERASEARKRIPGFDEILAKASVSPKHPEVLRLILGSEQAPELAVYCAQNPEFVHKLNTLQPWQATAEIGGIAARLSQPQKNTVTKAPSPVGALKGNAAPTGKKPWEMSMQEYSAWRAKKTA